MMALRDKRKRSTAPSLAARLGGAATVVAVGVAGVGAATTERVVTDYHTGLAISGFDPVAYFAKSAALPGRAEIEARFAGATWRFRNLGNRAAFMTHPDAYMPAFGGYDPTGVARGVAVAGHPEVWSISGRRLYLFQNEKTRSTFAANPAPIIAAAERRWREVESALVR
jgi:hypothetical protein